MRTSLPRLSPWRIAALGLPALALIALGGAWVASRRHPHATPAWDDAAFVALRHAAGGPEQWLERWVVVTHPRCPHCRQSLGHLARARDRAAAPVRISALVVDTQSPPPDSILARLTADEVRWDATGRWRAQWGHRVYGEVLCFDSAGALIRQLAPLADADDATARLARHGLDVLFD